MTMYASRALAERPRDISAAFGLTSVANGFFALAMPEPGTLYANDLREAILDARLVAAEFPQTEFHDEKNDMRRHIGSTVRSFSCSNKDQDFERNIDEKVKLFAMPPPANRSKQPWIRKVVMPKNKTVDMADGTRIACNYKMEFNMFMDENNYPRWVIATVLEATRVPMLTNCESSSSSPASSTSSFTFCEVKKEPEEEVSKTVFKKPNYGVFAEDESTDFFGTSAFGTSSYDFGADADPLEPSFMLELNL